MKVSSPTHVVTAGPPPPGGVGATLGPFVVKLPKTIQFQSQRHGHRRRCGKVKPMSSDSPSSSSLVMSNNTVPTVDIGSGPRDQILFDAPCNDHTPVLNLPSPLRRKKGKNHRKTRTLHRQPAEQWDPGPSTLERESSQNSDSSSDSLSVRSLATSCEIRINDGTLRMASPLSLLRRHAPPSARML
jgi:hypothetical protein